MKSKNVNLTKFIFFWWVAIALIWGLFALVKSISKLSTEYKETKAIRQEEQRLDWILEEINTLYLTNDELKKQRDELEQQQTEIHNSAEENRKQIDTLWNEYYKDKVDSKVMNKICELSKDSPMCNNYTMLNKLKEIADHRNVDYKLLLGIMYAESHIGANFNKENCRQTNNWAWVKARKYDDGTVSEKFDKQYQTLDKDLNGCWLYYFEDVETFFESLANTIWIWYKSCNEDPYCIMKYYVGHESWAWVRNVYLFKSL